MAYKNTHFIPRLILRKFYENGINLYNFKTNTLSRPNLKEAFARDELYPEWLEKLIANKVEGPFGDLLNNKILKSTDKIELTRKELIIIKRFLVVLQCRSLYLLDENPIEFDKNSLLAHKFDEIEIENESPKEKVYRTLKVLCEVESFEYEDIKKHPEHTIAAYWWGSLYNSCDITFWDSKDSGEDFFISDCGMTCEHEKSKRVSELYLNNGNELCKEGYIIKELVSDKYNDKQRAELKHIMDLSEFVRANFYMFNISETRMIGLVNPYFRLCYPNQTGVISKVFPTKLSKETLKPSYVVENDKYTFNIINLVLADVIKINCYMLDRVQCEMAFSETSKIKRSLSFYQCCKDLQPLTLNNYRKLFNELESNGYNFSNYDQYKFEAEEFLNADFSKEECLIIAYMFDKYFAVNKESIRNKLIEIQDEMKGYSIIEIIKKEQDVIGSFAYDQFVNAFSKMPFKDKYSITDFSLEIQNIYLYYFKTI